MGEQAPGPAGWVTGAVAAIVLLTGAARIAIDRVAGPVTASGPTSGAQAGAWFGAVMPGTSGSVDALLRIGDGAGTGGPRIPPAPGQIPSPANSPLLGGQRFESTVAAGTLNAPGDASPGADAPPAPPAPSPTPPSAPVSNTPTASPSPAPPPATTTTTSPPPATTTTTSPPPSSTTTTDPPSTTSTTTPSSTTTTTAPPPAAPTSQG